MKSKRYRYILSGVVEAEEPLSNFRLVAGNKLMGQLDAIRVTLPDNITLDKCPCDSYSTTEDKRTIGSLDYDVLIRIDDKWKIRNDLKQYQPHEYHRILAKEGLRGAVDRSYLTPDKYKSYIDEIKEQRKI